MSIVDTAHGQVVPVDKYDLCWSACITDPKSWHLHIHPFVPIQPVQLLTPYFVNMAGLEPWDISTNEKIWDVPINSKLWLPCWEKIEITDRRFKVDDTLQRHVVFVEFPQRIRDNIGFCIDREDLNIIKHENDNMWIAGSFK